MDSLLRDYDEAVLAANNMIEKMYTYNMPWIPSLIQKRNPRTYFSILSADVKSIIHRMCPSHWLQPKTCRLSKLNCMKCSKDIFPQIYSDRYTNYKYCLADRHQDTECHTIYIMELVKSTYGTNVWELCWINCLITVDKKIILVNNYFIDCKKLAITKSLMLFLGDNLYKLFTVILCNGNQLIIGNGREWRSDNT